MVVASANASPDGKADRSSLDDALEENDGFTVCTYCSNELEICECVCNFCGERDMCECVLFDAVTGGG